jgi:fructokinase
MLPSGKRAGGAPVNFIYHASMNGADGRAISAVGRDELGDELAEATREAGIDSILQHNEWPTGTVAVALKNGIPQYTIVKNVAWDHIRPSEELTGAVEHADAVCFGTLGLRSAQSHDTIVDLLDHTKPGAMKFFDINLRGDQYSRALIEELLAKATIFKLNDDELALIRDMFDIHDDSDTDACRRILTTCGLDYIILTAGSEFSTIISKSGEVSTVRTPKVEVRDTVGAGDSFSGTFAAKILTGASLVEAHRAAVNTAAFVCTQDGAWPQYPERIPDYLAQAGR